jgi:phenylacetate-coenzyme A ligase PaaK-like adenylate-forming protein
VDVESWHRLPVTGKDDLLRAPAAFLAGDTRPHLSTRTTGTTGRPAEIWMSRYEAELWPSLAALAGVLRGEIAPEDCMHIAISSRATAAVQHDVAVCRLAGARVVVAGVVPPEEALDDLVRSGATLLSTYPSYLAGLVLAAERQGLRPGELRLRRVDCGGEILSPAVRRAAERTLGAPVNDTFAMTEVLPVSARSCRAGHLHHDLNAGYVEVLDPRTGRPAAPGGLGTVVVTPYFPYRDCMPVLRYDTRDLVRAVPDADLGCELAGTPGTSRVLGKADRLLVRDGVPLVERDLVEALEDAPTRPWPVRFSVEQRHGDVLVHLAAEQFDGMTVAEVERLLHDRCVPATPVLHRAGALPDGPRSLRLVRADLAETTFRSAPRGLRDTPAVLVPRTQEDS